MKDIHYKNLNSGKITNKHRQHKQLNSTHKRTHRKMQIKTFITLLYINYSMHNIISILNCSNDLMFNCGILNLFIKEKKNKSFKNFNNKLVYYEKKLKSQCSSALQKFTGHILRRKKQSINGKWNNTSDAHSRQAQMYDVRQ